MALSFLYWALRRLLELVVLRSCSRGRRTSSSSSSATSCRSSSARLADPSSLTQIGLCCRASAGCSPLPLVSVLRPVRDAPALAPKARRPTMDVSVLGIT